MAAAPVRLLGGMTLEQFLGRHWHKRPLLVRDAWPGFETPVSAEELAGLACEEQVESRIVVGSDADWTVRHGPFGPHDFEQLGDSGWTLLVQALDRLLPAAARILEPFRFVPNWRLDDLMVSYATPGGSVGPHVDNYDVFLLQGSGRRRWMIHEQPVVDERLLPHPDLAVLADFSPDAEWVLEPGDMLYLPPRIAHHGVAVGGEEGGPGLGCMTFSIGFRAPSHRDLAGAFLAAAIDRMPDDVRYADPDLGICDDPGEIDDEARSRFHTIVRGTLDDEAAFDRWLGRFLTEPKRERPPQPPERVSPAAIERALEDGARLDRAAVPYFAWYPMPDDGAFLFVGGREYELDPDLRFAAPLLCGRNVLDRTAFAPHRGHRRFLQLVTTLVNEGFLIVEPGG